MLYDTKYENEKIESSGRGLGSFVARVPKTTRLGPDSVSRPSTLGGTTTTGHLGRLLCRIRTHCEKQRHRGARVGGTHDLHLVDFESH